MIRGNVKITTISDDGVEEVCDSSNLITAGMSYNLAAFFSAEKPSQAVDAFQVGYFQIGTCSVGYISVDTSSQPYFYQLQTMLPETSFGDDIDADVVDLKFLKAATSFSVTSYNAGVSSANTTTPLVSVENSQKIYNSDDTVTHRLVLEKNFAPNVNIRELGLFAKNPDYLNKKDVPILVAYKKLKDPINKSANMKVFIDWTIKFADY